MLPPTDGRIWARGRPPVNAGNSATLWALQLAEEDLFPANPQTQEIQTVTRQPPVPAELPWLVGMKYPDIPVVFDESVIRYLNHFRFNPGGRATIRSWIERSNRYRAMILNVLARNRLPSALLYIAMIESGFEPTTRSHAGALGLWQFMPDGAKVYGLRVNHHIDQRMDPELSTEAVMMYFEDLYFRFNNWHVALAAYNGGYGRMLQSIRRYQSNDFWKLQKFENALPRETQLYVPKWIAVAIADLNRDKFMLPKLNMREPYAFEIVTVPGGMTFAAFAKMAQSTVQEITNLNPEFLRRRMPPGEKWVRARVPWGKKTAFDAALRKLSPDWADFQVHRVGFGETLQGIAIRYRTTTGRLRSMNGLSSSAEVVPGLMMVVPQGTPLEEPVHTPPSTPFVAVPGDIAVPDGKERFFYRTCAGDTLEILSEGLGVSMDDLVAWNHLHPESALPSGMFLQVFLAEKGHGALFAAETVKVVPIDGEEFIAHYLDRYDRVRIRHTLTAGQTLDAVAKRYGTTASSIRTINRGYSFKTGETIIVYAKKAQAPKSALTRKEPSPQEDPESATPPEKDPGMETEKDSDPVDESVTRDESPKDSPKPAGPEEKPVAPPGKPEEKPVAPPGKPEEKPVAPPGNKTVKSPPLSNPGVSLPAHLARILINLSPSASLLGTLKTDQQSATGRVWHGRIRETPPEPADGSR